MSLILLVGVPGSGKTTLANKLKQKFEDMKQDCVIVTEKGPEAGTFDSSNNERLGRSDFKAAVGRMLSLERVVICDGMNFIKGFRYEIFCLARENHLTWCVAFCDVDDETAFNRSQEKYHNDKRLKKLIGRMERPSTTTKFDNPLIVVKDINNEETIDQIIKAALNKSAKLIPKKATTSCAETAHYNDKVDQLINQFCQELEKIQATAPTGTPITVCGATFTPKKKFTSGLLKKARREFAARAKSLSGEQNVVQIFADSLEVIH